MRLNFNTEFYSLALFVRPRDSCLKEPITKSLTILIQLKRKSCNTNEVNGIKNNFHAITCKIKNILPFRADGTSN